MQFAAQLLIAATLLFGSGCAKSDWIDRTLVTVDVTGTWSGSVVSPDGQPMISSEVRFELQQKGSRVLGSVQALGFGTMTRGSMPIEGSVGGDVFTFKEARGSLAGELAVSEDEMRGQGTVGGGRSVTFNLRRVDASPPQTLPPR
jgi:hypothetical protein